MLGVRSNYAHLVIVIHWREEEEESEEAPVAKQKALTRTHTHTHPSTTRTEVPGPCCLLFFNRSEGFSVKAARPTTQSSWIG